MSLWVKYLPLVLFGSALLFGTVSCSGSEPTTSAVEMGEEFSLALEESVTIESPDLTLHFVDVAEDDRCPTRVECEWAGQAVVLVEYTLGESETETLEFNTNPWPDVNLQTITRDGIVYELVRLDPYPEHPDRPIQIEDYRAVMVIREN